MNNRDREIESRDLQYKNSTLRKTIESNLESNVRLMCRPLNNMDDRYMVVVSRYYQDRMLNRSSCEIFAIITDEKSEFVYNRGHKNNYIIPLDVPHLPVPEAIDYALKVTVQDINIEYQKYFLHN